jgi:hypothetical protein
MSDQPAWEPVCVVHDAIDRLDRIRVPGGWLYRTEVWREEESTVAMCFVPIPPGMARAGD